VDFNLLCSYDGDSLIYQTPDGYPCYINTVGITENLSRPQISISPNPVPACSGFRIKSKKQIAVVKMYDSSGKLRFQMNNVSNQELTLQSKDLTKGLFLLFVQIDDNRFYRLV